jgi:GxxExxY protein
MPIELSIPIPAICQDDFHRLDKEMLAHAFAIHRDMGRLLDEKVYKAELTNRCQRAGLTAQREVLIRVEHGRFAKDYFIDLIVGGSAIVEAKTAKTLTQAHRAQVLNYLLLAGVQHGSLVNFRPPSVQRLFVSTRLTHALRTQFQAEYVHWPRLEGHLRLQEAVLTLCKDLGLGLDLALYREAFVGLLGLPQMLVPIISNGGTIGSHEMHLLDPDTALAVTALSGLSKYRTHLLRLLKATPLSGMAWVNLDLGCVSLIHLERNMDER